jgi:hypothetical protein
MLMAMTIGSGTIAEPESLDHSNKSWKRVSPAFCTLRISWFALRLLLLLLSGVRQIEATSVCFNCRLEANAKGERHKGARQI